MALMLVILVSSLTLLEAGGVHGNGIVTSRSTLHSGFTLIPGFVFLRRLGFGIHQGIAGFAF